MGNRLNVLNVLYQFNEKYAPYAGVSVTSLLENNKAAGEISIYILGEDLSKGSVNKFKELGKRYNRKIIFKDTEEIIQKMHEWGIPAYRGSYAANIRLFLPYVLDEDFDRLLYLDADTIVVGDIFRLMYTDLHGKALGMVVDSLGSKRGLEIGLNKDDSYFNSGVVLYDYKAWKDNMFSQKIKEHICEGNTEYAAPDQDLLNVVCRGAIHALSPRYNLQPVHLAYPVKVYFSCYQNRNYYSREEIEDSIQNPVIYHFFRFLGEFPWDKHSIHPDRELFDFYLGMSLWKDYKKEKSEATTLMKIEKILYILLPKSVFLRLFKYMHNKYVNQKKEISCIADERIPVRSNKVTR